MPLPAARGGPGAAAARAAPAVRGFRALAGPAGQAAGRLLGAPRPVITSASIHASRPGQGLARSTMDHYIPKRRVPVTLWSRDLQGVAGSIFLDLDASGARHQTILEKLNESSPFLPAAVGEEGRIHLFNKSRLVRVTPGRLVLQTDVFTRGFQPWREEEAEIVLADGLTLQGKVWMPLQRESQRLSDFMNQQVGGLLRRAHLGGPAPGPPVRRGRSCASRRARAPRSRASARRPPGHGTERVA